MGHQVVRSSITNIRRVGYEMSIKVNPADQAFSRCVRTAAKWTCERCGSVHEEKSQGLHCSHIFSRRHRTIRWSRDNVQALCFSCHQWFGGNPADSGYWVSELLGDGHMQLLREKKDSKVKVSKLEEKEIAKHYRAELKKLQDGAQDFESWQ